MATETVDETTSAAAGDLARVSAMLEAIERLSESLEDTSDARSFALVTALQACTESARRACAAAEAALQNTGVAAAAPPPDEVASDRELLQRAGDALATAQRMGNTIGTLVGKLEDTIAAHGDPEDYDLYLALEACIEKHENALRPAREAVDEVIVYGRRTAAAEAAHA